MSGPTFNFHGKVEINGQHNGDGDQHNYFGEKPLHPLLQIADDLGLIKNEKDLVEALAAGDGVCDIPALAEKFKWKSPTDDFNSLRKRVNKKLEAHGWEITRSGEKAKAERIEAGT